MEKNITKYNHIFAHFELSELPEIIENKEQREALMWHIIDGIRLYDLWIMTSVYEGGEELMWEQVRDHLMYRYDAEVLKELRYFIGDKAHELNEAILAISEKDEDGMYVTPLGLGDDGAGDWCKFVVGLGREYYEDLMNDADFLRETCEECKGYQVECLIYPINEAIGMQESE